jgi:hypothetical protein
MFAVSANANECLSYALKSNVMLTGIVQMRAFPGPPNYESIEGGDRRDVQPILVLTKPVCVDGKTALSSFDVSEPMVREMQLLVPFKLRAQMAALAGKVGSYRGHLMHQDNAQHRTAVLLIVEAIK